MSQKWFEMDDIIRRKNKVWIPLRVSKTTTKGTHGYDGFSEEYTGVGSIAVPLKHKPEINELEWKDIGIISQHSGFYQDGKYIPADVYRPFNDGLSCIHLVLEQKTNRLEKSEWHLHQDFVVTLGLKREEDSWISPNEGYVEVARIHKDVNGNPFLLEVRAEHLKDYLCARNMALYTTSFFSRHATVKDASPITWQGLSKKLDKGLWQGAITEIHEGGFPFGEEMNVFHVSRTDIDESEDIPDISKFPTQENTVSKSWTQTPNGKKLYRISGELWLNEWVEPSPSSPRVKEDETPPSVFFIVDEKGSKENKEILEDSGKWLWFKPDVIMALAHKREVI